MLIELRIKGVTEYSVCSRSFSVQSESDMPKSESESEFEFEAELGIEGRSDNSDTSSMSLSPICAFVSLFGNGTRKK